MKPFTLKIKTALLKRGVTVTQLSQQLGYRRDQVSMTIHGIREYPEIREAIAEAIGVTGTYLFGQRSQRNRKAA